ncbi:MAG: ArsR/SmtB family transcription factor [Phycisphaerales bacterium]
MAPVCQHPSSPRSAVRRRAAIDRLLDPELFRAVGEPTRAAILASLIKCGRSCSVTEVAEACSVDFSVVARHLHALARAGLLDSERSGRTLLYRPKCAELCERLRLLIAAIEEWCPNIDPRGGRGACCARRTKGVCP